jgi:hypothetical protein
MGEAHQPRFRTASPPRLSRGNAPRFSFRLNSGPLGHKCRSTAPIGCRPRPAFKATPASREWAVVAPLGAGSTSRSSAARDRARERPVRRKGALLGDSVDAPVHVPEQAGEPGSGGLRRLLAADGESRGGKPSLSTYLRRRLMCVALFARPNAGLLVLVQSKHELGDRRGRPLRHGMQASPRSTRVAGRARAHASANRRRPFRPAARPSTGRPGGAKLRSRNRRAASPV